MLGDSEMSNMLRSDFTIPGDKKKINEDSLMNRPRILIIENSVDITGALHSIVRSSSDLLAHFEFVFVLPEGSKAIPNLLEIGFQVHTLPMKELRKRILSIISYLPQLFINAVRYKSLVKSVNADLVICNDFYNLIPVIYSMLGGKVPYICYVRFRPSKFPALLVKVWSFLHRKFAASVIAVSQIVKKELPFSDDVMVISNELPRISIPYSPGTSKTILYPSNYIQGKGHEYALRSFAKVCARFPDWKLKFVGGDMGLKKNRAYKAALIQESEHLGISSQIEWRGFARDMIKEYVDAAFVLNFSESESFSLTCLEAMFYGRTVIATKSGGPVEIIDDHETGLLVEIGDIHDMAKAIDYLMSNEPERIKLSEYAYRKVREKFSFDHTASKLKDAYLAALLK